MVTLMVFLSLDIIQALLFHPNLFLQAMKSSLCFKQIVVMLVITLDSNFNTSHTTLVSYIYVLFNIFRNYHIYWQTTRLFVWMELFMGWLETAIAMMKPTMEPAIMMEETVVALV